MAKRHFSRFTMMVNGFAKWPALMTPRQARPYR
jgi:hypothetical protein